MEYSKSDGPLYLPVVFPLIAMGNREIYVAEGFIDIYSKLYNSKGIMSLRKEHQVIVDLMNESDEAYGVGKYQKYYETYVKMKQSEDPVIYAHAENYRIMAIRKSPMYLTRLGILYNLHSQHNHWGKLNKKSLLNFIGVEPIKVTNTMIDIIHFLNVFTDNPYNDNLYFSTKVDGRDSMLKWMERKLKLGTGQGAVRDRIMNTIEFIRKNVDNNLEDGAITNTGWYFRNKEEILEAMINIYVNIKYGIFNYVSE